MGKNVAAGLMDVIEAIGPKNIITITTDNASNMKKAWKEIQAVYPLMICIGYSSHMTNLLLKDIIVIPKLANCFEAAKTVIKYFRTHAVPAAVLKNHQFTKYNKRLALLLPGNTRWQGTTDSLKSLLHSKVAL